ncbi:uncharacterized protein Z518_04998 [Rhinocladiella mackenziei CBS 650.93]|uniref:Uncharacterized protein n=1 Tax=Rhinocladiella mackenziei CBS 650.93 TaxID=1442369 RepID=A0A0D2FXL0_9EURO|nr:uncharacterized protein Z518_04998 [Rhinocladiella mackenziei CBS 650.93]KIX07022.1 hypothetical protein Z518_04998 [Rhinocladiella mackenziei CBS 650.93]
MLSEEAQKEHDDAVDRGDGGDLKKLSLVKEEAIMDLQEERSLKKTVKEGKTDSRQWRWQKSRQTAQCRGCAAFGQSLQYAKHHSLRFAPSRQSSFSPRRWAPAVKIEYTEAVIVWATLEDPMIRHELLSDLGSNLIAEMRRSPISALLETSHQNFACALFKHVAWVQESQSRPISMAPIRRYLRISRYSVLECRIFLENPADERRWLLSENDPALPRVFEAIKPYVLPKLREENERARGKGKKKKSVKDVVQQDDFEVSIFLTEIRTRHAFLAKNKTFKQKLRMKSNNGNKLTGIDRDTVMIQDEGHEENVNLEEIPLAKDLDDEERDRDVADIDPESVDDDTKKLGIKTTYEGFSIWGWVLCLFIERKGSQGKKSSGNAQALMQDWIASTQEQKDD